MPEDLQAAAAAVAAELNQSSAERHQAWIKDGTKSAEPETVETPAKPDADAAAPVVPEQPRGPDGRFLPAGSPPVTADTPTAAPTTATPESGHAAAAGGSPAAPASADDVQEFIEAQLGDQPFKLPKGVRLPLKRGDAVEFAPVEELMKGGMLERDYRIKTAETARRNREVEEERRLVAVERARIKAREDWLAEQEALYVEAQKDPEKWEQYQEHQRMLQTNPRYRKTWEDGLRQRETDAELATVHERAESDAIESGTTQALEWIRAAAVDPAFAGVDAERVRARYADLLSSGRAQLDPAEVQYLFQQEADYLQRSVAPVLTKIATLEAEIQALKTGKAAGQHNATTAHAITRAKTPPVATGQPPAPAAPAPGGRFGPRELAERNAAWSRQR